MKPKSILSWLLRLTASLILLQTLYFKFTAHPESVYIFEKVGIEPVGRIGTGVLELVAGILLLYPKTIVYGAFLGASLMVGAIATHVFILGIEVQNDGGQLFIMGCMVFLSCILLLYLHRKDFIAVAYKLKSTLSL